MARRVAVIDADTDIYSVSANAEIKTDEHEYLPVLDERYAFRKLVNHLEWAADQIEADDLIVCVSDENNWRKLVLADYKANRADKRKPAFVSKLRARLLEADLPFPVLKIKHLEADDVCGITAGHMAARNREPVIVSADKDLATVPGLLWNPRPSRAGNKRQVEEISTARADRNHLFQTLTGDPTDNYKGCPGIGPVKAITLLNEYEDAEPEERWAAIVAAFVDRGCTADDAVVQARIARILRVSDWDADRHKVILWNPPTK